MRTSLRRLTIPYFRDSAQTSRAADPRRRGSALILVITVLGILFVAGLAFISTMNFESQLVSLERATARRDSTIDLSANLMQGIITSSWLEAPGRVGDVRSLGQPVRVPDPGNQGTDFLGFDVGLRPVQATDAYLNNLPPAVDPTYAMSVPRSWVELPGVQGFSSQLEPSTVSIPGGAKTAYLWYTDLDRLFNGPSAGSIFETRREIDVNYVDGSGNMYVRGNLDYLNTAKLPNGQGDPQAPQVVDADGDGMVDSLLVDLERIRVPRAQRLELARVVNPPGSSSTRAFIGVRVVPHGGMVNVAEAHPLLIQAAIGDDPTTYASTSSLRDKAYISSLEESSLRRRGWLPSRALPPSVLQGDPLAPYDLNNPGDGDFSIHLFPPGETCYLGEHRYWPFTTEPNDFLAWQSQIDPELPQTYDRRHLITTVSHDDLLARPVYVKAPDIANELEDADLVDVMTAVNLAGAGTLAFELPNYPQTIANGPNNIDWLACAADPYCKLDPRKGRLKLSIPWLDDPATIDDGDGNDNTLPPLTNTERTRLIQDFFGALLLNMRSTNESEFGNFDPNASQPGKPRIWLWKSPIGSGVPSLPLAEAAAALTANMLDFADDDDIPTRVAIRSLDMADLSAAGSDVLVSGELQYAYGLEKQPYITEIATEIFTEDTGTGLPTDQPTWAISAAESAYYIELYNPNDTSIQLDPDGTLSRDYFIQVNANNPVRIQLSGTIPANEYFVAYHQGNKAYEVDPAQFRNRETKSGIALNSGDTVYLLMRHQFPGDPQPSFIVVDQYFVHESLCTIGQSEGFADPQVQSSQRSYNPVQTGKSQSPIAAARVERWYAPIPLWALRPGLHTLGNRNDPTSSNLRHVQVVQANNCGDLIGINGNALPNTTRLTEAFPTTGSMYLLMRYANRSIDDAVSNGGAVPDDRLAFTTQLAGTQGSTKFGVNIDQDAHTRLDNGRMPVFDEAFRYHINPNKDSIAPLDSDPLGLPNVPGDATQLPWGQLIYDYFTALPLSNPSIWSNRTGLDDVAFEQQQQAAKPRVDLDGLRVHGRIDLNAAPATVLRGLPIVPMTTIPQAFRDAVRVGVGLGDDAILAPANQIGPRESEGVQGGGANLDDADAVPIKEAIVDAIMAYRELGPNLNNTGDFNDDDARGWTATAPRWRRGTGFLTVGELLNVRHPNAAYVHSNFPLGYINNRIDGGAIGEDSADYISAVSMMVALGEWATVRSHVYTVYGSLWGELGADGATREQLEERAWRFQETLDRLPTYLGAKRPSRIGERTVVRYKDSYSD